MRIITWNVWGLYGPRREREAAIAATLREARPDIVVLAESWAKDGDSQCARLAGSLGLPHHAFSGVAAQEDAAALSGVAVMSRWPIQRQSSLTFGDARVQFAERPALAARSRCTAWSWTPGGSTRARPARTRSASY
ncbi:MAG: endonuclease/exonuclease/phosphatase family protein [Actinomycetota bacterium]